MRPLNETPEQKSERIAHLRKNFSGMSRSQRCQEIMDLPLWVRRAIAMHDLLGMTWRNVAKKMGRTKDSQLEGLRQYVSTPGGKKYREAIKSAAGDPVEVVRKVAAHDSGELYFQLYEHLAICREAGDLAEAGRTLRNLIELTGAQPPKNVPQPIAPIINITLPGAVGTITAEIPHGESEHQALMPGEIVQDDE